ncbi:MAG: alpha/beta hydrolase [Alphaproteobacteria bacterium]|nr:alpha/beta hydrolase [Alphaproteobacteria bacterium]
MVEHRIKGGGGLELFVNDQGPKDAPALLFVHGWAQSHACWQEQAELAENYRLVALDLRGHGASDKPEELAAYTDVSLWGADINAVIQELNLDNPILVGWSYGCLVLATYLDAYGDSDIAGVVLAGGTLAIGDAREAWMIGDKGAAINFNLVSNNDADRLTATREFVANCTAEPLDDDLTEKLVASNMQCPAHVRRSLFAYSWDVQPVYKKLSKPALVIHGVEDRVVAPLVGITASELIPNADLALYESTGHAPFLEQPERFNTDLSQFATLAFGAAP